MEQDSFRRRTSGESNHLHMIFTIDEELRDVFLLHRYLLKGFMDEAVGLLLDYFQKKTKVTSIITTGFTPSLLESILIFQSTYSYISYERKHHENWRMEKI
ncbi:hypothetical protein [Bacillus paramycoides]|uniref:hypothetical protein n=1 Tax=Bacillus paramycoides TaxID=2026194 RepID=UPI002E1F451E|nr:hypothetical protein [Bacillus paramycoides]